jgi:hypothetical protein
MGLTMTVANLRELLESGAEQPVLYVARDEWTLTPMRLAVRDESEVPRKDVVVDRTELGVVGAADDDDLDYLLLGYQVVLDEILEN